MSDAEKVVKALRAEAEFARALGDASVKAERRAARQDALADFVARADAVVGRPDLVEPTKRQLALYDAALARLAEVFDA